MSVMIGFWFINQIFVRNSLVPYFSCYQLADWHYKSQCIHPNLISEDFKLNHTALRLPVYKKLYTCIKRKVNKQNPLLFKQWNSSYAKDGK